MKKKIDKNISVSLPYHFEASMAELSFESHSSEVLYVRYQLLRIEQTGLKTVRSGTAKVNPVTENNTVIPIDLYAAGSHILNIGKPEAIPASKEIVFSSYHLCGELSEIQNLDPETEASSALSLFEEFKNYSYGDLENPNLAEYEVHILLGDCLVERDQQYIRGGSVVPMVRKYGLESSYAQANAYIQTQGFSGNFSYEDTSQPFVTSDSPVTVVRFHSVFTSASRKALDLVNPYLLTVIKALSLDRNASAEPIAYLVKEKGSKEIKLFPPRKIYRGHSGGGFSNSPLTDLIGDVDRAIVNEPWIDTGLQMFDEAKREKDRRHKLRKSWSLLENRAKIIVPKSNAAVNDDQHQPIQYRGRTLTNNHDVGRVITYMRDYVKFSVPNRNGHRYDLSRTIMKAYVIRNIIVHEGGTDLYTRTGTNDVEQRCLDFFNDNGGNMGRGALDVEDWASELVKYEIRKHR